METTGKYDLERIGLTLSGEQFPVRGISMMGSSAFQFTEPARYMGIALHAGSVLRPGLEEALAVTAPERNREEDLYTELFLEDFPLHITGCDSRFEYDLNWEIEQCIYPAHVKKWGLKIRNGELSREERELSHRKYREFHELLDMVVEYMLGRGSPAIIFDIHSFCYQREGGREWFLDEKPEINLGTRYIDRKRFTPLINGFLEGLSGARIEGQPVRVAENRLFPGGYITRKYRASHPGSVLVLAIEFKKIYMDERTGTLHRERLDQLIHIFRKAKEQVINLL